MSTISYTDPATMLPATHEGDDALWIDVDSGDVPLVVNGLLEHAASLHVSDLFFCAEEFYYSVSARHLGLWQVVSQVPKDLGKRCLAHIKSMAGMDIAERRRPLDGRWMFEHTSGEAVDLRVSTIPTMHGEDCTLRFLTRQAQFLSLDKLGLAQRDYNHLLQLLNNPGGLLLVTGPTGSGKTTTVYGCVNYLNNGQRKINTIEDPIEYALVRVRQSQVNPVIDLGFASILRGVLRQAPDVIMVGEIRDVETALIAVQAAATGHLVLATVHASMAAAAVQSMLTLGVHPHHLGSCLLGCVAQRLIRTLDPETKVPYDVTMAPGIFEEVERWLGPGEGERIYGPPSGGRNPSLGYTGRTGVFEVMPVSRTIRQLIMQEQPTAVIRQQAVEEGMIEMRQAALLAVARGETSIEEVFRAIPAEYLRVDN
jgi:type II secretory ATPase GspE/PulE/Tfp pilus assembly ATPase PilB-like protein